MFLQLVDHPQMGAIEGLATLSTIWFKFMIRPLLVLPGVFNLSVRRFGWFLLSEKAHLEYCLRRQ